MLQTHNFLVDRLPDTVMVGGVEVSIQTDFRTGIRFTLLMQDDTLNKSVRIELMLAAYYGRNASGGVLRNWQEAIGQALWFYKSGRPERPRAQRSDDDNTQDGKSYDFEYDGSLIYAAFREQYGIDLLDIEYLHWWKFKALFAALSDATEFIKVVGYRSIELTDKMTSEDRARYSRLKKIYALPDNRTEEEKEEAFARSLLSL